MPKHRKEKRLLHTHIAMVGGALEGKIWCSHLWQMQHPAMRKQNRSRGKRQQSAGFAGEYSQTGMHSLAPGCCIECMRTCTHMHTCAHVHVHTVRRALRQVVNRVPSRSHSAPALNTSTLTCVREHLVDGRQQERGLHKGHAAATRRIAEQPGRFHPSSESGKHARTSKGHCGSACSFAF